VSDAESAANLPSGIGKIPGYQLVLISAFTAGALFRLVPYFLSPSLWLDEARLALNIGAKSFAGLLGPLAYDQSAPPLFLWIEKLAMIVGGPNEYALRALPLVAGLITPVLTYFLVARFAGKSEAALAAGLTALSPSLVQYSIQLKPYETDALVSVGLLLAFVVDSSRREDHGPGPVTLVLGAVAIWLSVTAPFVLAAIAVASYPTFRRKPQVFGALVLCWSLSFSVAYWLAYRSASANPYLRWFWSERLLTLWTPGVLGRAYGAAREVFFTSVVSDVFEVGDTLLAHSCLLLTASIVAIFALLGLRHLLRTNPAVAILFGGSISASLLASCLGLYPVAARMMLFAAPILLTLLVVGAAELYRTRPQLRMGILGVLGAIVLAGQLRNVVRADDPYRSGHLRPAVAFLQASLLPGEPIYVEAGALPAWTFYTTDWSHPDMSRLERMAHEASFGGGAFENQASRGRRVAGDGADLVFPFRDGVELLGVGDGGAFRVGARHKPPSDTGWAESEAQRIRMAARPTAWLVTIKLPWADIKLDAAIRSAGGVRRDSLVADYAVVARYQFANESASTR
jgi:Dolichyl-phosphate-mannose-protein mannosyltransferase